MARILLTNDDGILAPGIQAARTALQDLGHVVTVAPLYEQSASSHAITLTRPLRVRKMEGQGHAVTGTPADCVFMAFEVIMREQLPDLVISGINAGANLGIDVLYSGTVAAALQGALRGVPAIAISQVGYHDLDYSLAARFLPAIASDVLKHGLPAETVLNVNVPKRPQTPVKYSVTKLGRHGYSDVVEERSDPRNRPYYWIGGTWAGFEKIEGSDCVAISEGVISVTPLRVVLSQPDLVAQLAHRRVPGFEVDGT